MKTLEKITKAQARKMYAEHKDFIMCASGLRPDMFGRRVDSTCFERLIDCDFDTMVDYFQYYNCTNWETGLKVAFYKTV